MGGGPGLMVMGEDWWYSRGHRFESQHWILAGHYFTVICCKICNVCFKKPKINETEAEVGFLNTQSDCMIINLASNVIVRCDD